MPTAVELVEASKLVDDLFGDELARAATFDQKMALSEKLLNAGKDEKTDFAGKFVLLRHAKELAINAPDLASAFKAIDAMEQAFQVDGVRAKGEAAASIAKSPHADRKAFVTESQVLAGNALNLDEYDLAKQLDDLAVAIARQMKDPELIVHTTAQLQEVTDTQAAYTTLGPSETVLKTRPNDADANLKVGRFRCFFKDDWNTGLPHLAAGSDALLSGLAKNDVANPVSSADQVSVGDGWWKLGGTETGTAKKSLMARAAKWYRVAQPQLSGLTKVKVDRRLEQVNQMQKTSGQTKPEFTELLNTMMGNTGRKEGDIIVLKDDERILTNRSFHPPVTFKLTAMTDSTNLRIGYAADQMIFNWEDNRDQLRISGGPADGRHKNGAEEYRRINGSNL